MVFPEDLGQYSNACKPFDCGALLGLLPERRPDGHKGDYGHVLVVGGSAGFGGAPALAALAALRSGSGLVSAALPASLVSGPISRLAPEAMSHPIGERNGFIDENSFLTWFFARKRFDVIAIGPGLGQNPDTAAVVSVLLRMQEQPLLLDADALNLIAASEEGLASLKEIGSPLRIITPHHAEAARLLEVSVEEVISDRVGAAKELALRSGAIAVLKGRGTLVASPSGEKAEICLEGNPGMATGGSGDVLSGIIASLWGQGMSPFDAARLGVALHARAGDRAALRYGWRSMIARDIIEALPAAFGCN